MKTKFYCDLCGRVTSSKQHLLDHMHTHHMQIMFSCNLCSSRYRSSLKLRLHKQLVHKKKHKCESCDAVFGRPYLLTRHVKRIHEVNLWYCHYQGCWKTFSSKFAASRHLRGVHLLKDTFASISKYLKTERNDQVYKTFKEEKLFFTHYHSFIHWSLDS